LTLASANEENEVLVDRDEVPNREPFAPVLLFELALLKHLVAAELAEKGCFLLIRTL
jgi:hypothetical protein